MRHYPDVHLDGLTETGLAHCMPDSSPMGLTSPNVLSKCQHPLLVTPDITLYFCHSSCEKVLKRKVPSIYPTGAHSASNGPLSVPLPPTRNFRNVKKMFNYFLTNRINNSGTGDMQPCTENAEENRAHSRSSKPLR
jgi:hypothetical protein